VGHGWDQKNAKGTCVIRYGIGWTDQEASFNGSEDGGPKKGLETLLFCGPKKKKNVTYLQYQAEARKKGRASTPPSKKSYNRDAWLRHLALEKGLMQSPKRPSVSTA